MKKWSSCPRRSKKRMSFEGANVKVKVAHDHTLQGALPGGSGGTESSSSGQRKK